MNKPLFTAKEIAKIRSEADKVISHAEFSAQFKAPHMRALVGEKHIAACGFYSFLDPTTMVKTFVEA